MTGQDADWAGVLRDATVSETRRRAKPPDISPSGPLAREWATYHREVDRLLADSHRGRFALIRGNEVVALCDALEEAAAVARERLGSEPCLVLNIQPDNGRFRWGRPKCPD